MTPSKPANFTHRKKNFSIAASGSMPQGIARASDFRAPNGRAVVVAQSESRTPRCTDLLKEWAVGG